MYVYVCEFLTRCISLCIYICACARYEYVSHSYVFRLIYVNGTTMYTRVPTARNTYYVLVDVAFRIPSTLTRTSRLEVRACAAAQRPFARGRVPHTKPVSCVPPRCSSLDNRKRRGYINKFFLCCFHPCQSIWAIYFASRAMSLLPVDRMIFDG